MNALVVYDSKFGNTETIALAIAETLRAHAEVTVVKAADAAPNIVRDRDLIIAGAPTHAFRPSPPMKTFLKRLRRGSLKGARVAGFDTRIAIEDIDIRFVRWMAKTFGYAAPHITKRLKVCGGKVAGPTEGFFVGDTEGPLRDGELERAKVWVEGMKRLDMQNEH